jgi:uroporphyrin-III C-methyltransferase
MVHKHYKRKSQNPPMLTLIGAGPGDPDLITVKGLRKIAEADVLLYDALINTDLLRFAPARAIKILVGKRVNHHLFTQESINTYIVELAFKYGHVVRLKGGDPFVFGRGFEELSLAVYHQIPVEVVPGISSSTGVPGNCQLPLTLRGISESFWVIAGTTSNRQISDDIKIASQSTATVVILMGVHKIPEIVKNYKRAGKSEMPVAVIQEGTMKNQKRIYGTIETLEFDVYRNNIKPPAIIVIGMVVKNAVKIRFLDEKLKKWHRTISSKVKKGQFSNLNYINHGR